MNSLADGTVAPAAEQFLEDLIAARVIAADRAESLSTEFRGNSIGDDRASMAAFLVQGNHLTPFQAEKALAGQASRLGLGPYVLLDLVGNGSFGQVFRASSPGKRGRFALKLLPLRSMWNVIQAKRQLSAFRDLPYDSAVVPFLDIDTAGNSHYLVWPFVEGETFDSLVRRGGPLHPDIAVRWMTEVLGGLAICHKAGIVHGLLKPANLMVAADRKAKILDLGIGAILAENISEDESMMDTISTSNTAMSTIDCAAPETLANPTVRTSAGDVYSLGCVLYYLLCGRYPFPDGNIVDKMIAHQMQEPASPCRMNSDVPAALGDIVLNLLQKDPAQRPHDLTALTLELQAAAPNSLKLSVLDSLSVSKLSQKQVSGRLDWEKHPKSEQPSSHVGETLDSIDFNIAQTPKTDNASGRRGRAAGPPDSSAVDYFGTQSGSGESLQPLPPAVPSPVAVRKPAFADSAHPENMPRQIVLPTQVNERAGKLSSIEVKPVPATLDSQVELPQTAIQWTPVESLDDLELTLPPVFVPPPPPDTTTKWGAVSRILFFWRSPSNLVQFSLFGPTYLSPGQTYSFQVCAHMPEAFAGVRTLSRAFQADAELRAAGYGDKRIRRGAVIGLHLAVANAAVAQSIVRFPWVGQSKPRKFDVYVPWESPSGRTPGLLSIGLGTEAIGRIHFDVIVLPRSA